LYLDDVELLGLCMAPHFTAATDRRIASTTYIWIEMRWSIFIGAAQKTISILPKLDECFGKRSIWFHAADRRSGCKHFTANGRPRHGVMETGGLLRVPLVGTASSSLFAKV
jgi:hypothetical protein